MCNGRLWGPCGQSQLGVSPSPRAALASLDVHQSRHTMPNSMSPARLKGSVCCCQLTRKSSSKGSSEHNRPTLSALNLKKAVGCLLLANHSKHF